MLLKNRKLNRLRKWDYSSPGFYFVTICTQYFVKCFGQIENEQMILNKYGDIVKQQWLWMGKHFDCINLDEYIIMPNHFHGIVQIKRNAVGTTLGLSLRNEHGLSLRNEHGLSLRNENGLSLRNENGLSLRNALRNKIYNRRINLLSKSICAFKTTSSKLIHKNGMPYFKWQRSYHDHIIRNQHSLNRIRQYIINNPKKWNRDRNNKYLN